MWGLRLAYKVLSSCERGTFVEKVIVFSGFEVRFFKGVCDEIETRAVR